MAVSPAMRRLLRVRDLEEEQHRAALESALGELHRLEAARAAARARERKGRERIVHSASSGDAADRIAGMVEAEAGQRRAVLLGRRIVEAELQAAELRRLYLLKRVERRQAETVIREAEALESVEGARREQQRLDDWFRAMGPARDATRTGEQSPRTTTAPGKRRQLRENHEMKSGTETDALPEEELRSHS